MSAVFLPRFLTVAAGALPGWRLDVSYAIQFAYLVATALFIFSLKWMSDPVTARRGVIAGVGGMLLAVIGTLLDPQVVHFGAIAVICGIALILHPTMRQLFPLMICLSLLFGVLLIVPIGGADMPTVISLLNSYAGLSAVAMGFVLDNKLLITAGALDGSSGFILSVIMCRAMNRSFGNVLFGAFGQASKAGAEKVQRTVKSETPEGAAQVLEQAQLVVVIPGYGMAVAQAQHLVRELYDQLTRRGITVKFAIHPVAGRMPGHMNVLLAEAEIPYDRLVEMDDINHEMHQVDVAPVVGANDVVNPAARHDPGSPIYGMPIIEADKARTCFAIKRSMNPGSAGIENELYYADRTFMIFGDAKKVIGELVKQLAGGGLH